MNTPQESPSELRQVLLEKVELLNERMSTLHDLFRSNFAVNDFSDLSPEKQEELVVALENMRELKWLADVLPGVEMQLTGEEINGGLEHALCFQYGLTARQLLEDPESLGRISATAYLWRIIGPLLKNMLSDRGFDPAKSFLSTSKNTPYIVNRLLGASPHPGINHTSL